MAEDHQAQIDELKERISTLERLLKESHSLADTIEVLSGRFMFFREVVRRYFRLGPHISIPEVDIEALFPQVSKAKDAFLEELDAYNDRRHI